MNDQRWFKVTEHIDYTVEATSEDEAIQIIECSADRDVHFYACIERFAEPHEGKASTF